MLGTNSQYSDEPRNRHERRAKAKLERLGLTFEELQAKPYHSTSEAAVYTGWSESSFNKARLRGDGPPFSKIGRSVVYARSDLDTWIAERRVQSTSQAGALAANNAAA